MPSRRRVWLNGEYVSESEAKFSVFDSGVTGGRMVFETSRTFGGRPFLLEGHLDRLIKSMDLAGIGSELGVAGLTAATTETLEQNRVEFRRGEDFIITHNVSGGIPEYMAQMTGLRAGPNISIHLWPLRNWQPERADWYDSGVRAIVVQRPELQAAALDPGIKHRNRLAFHLAEQAAQAVDGQGWALLADSEGRVTEGTTANFMLVKDGKLVSPPTDVALAGLTRQAIVDLAQDAGIQFEERHLERDDIYLAEEAFFCASTFVIMPVAQVDGRPFGDPVPGSITRILTKAFSNLVGLDFVAQGKHYAGLM